jgi:hypothetical protein
VLAECIRSQQCHVHAFNSAHDWIAHQKLQMGFEIVTKRCERRMSITFLIIVRSPSQQLSIFCSAFLPINIIISDNKGDLHFRALRITSQPMRNSTFKYSTQHFLFAFPWQSQRSSFINIMISLLWKGKVRAEYKSTFYFYEFVNIKIYKV